MSDLRHTILAIRPLDHRAMEKAQIRQNNLAKPQGSLGRLEKLSVKLSGIKGELPRLEHKAIITMVADHGVTAQGVSAHPSEITTQMVYALLEGGGAICMLARQVGAKLILVDMGVASDLIPNPKLISKKIAHGTCDISEGPAMTRDEAERSIEAGIDIIEAECSRGLDIVGTGDMGIGNTTPSSAICSSITGQPVIEITGMGAGLDKEGVAHKVEIIERALETNKPDPKDPIDVLAKVGGFEIGGLAGVILGAAANRVPIVIDGFVSGAAALIAVGLAPRTREYIIASHISAEPGHTAIIDHLRMEPLLDLGMRLGEGTGAALGIFLAEAASRTLTGIWTFDEMLKIER